MSSNFTDGEKSNHDLDVSEIFVLRQIRNKRIGDREGLSRIPRPNTYNRDTFGKAVETLLMAR